MLVDKYFQTWLLTGWQHSHQPVSRQVVANCKVYCIIYICIFIRKVQASCFLFKTVNSIIYILYYIYYTVLYIYIYIYASVNSVRIASRNCLSPVRCLDSIIGLLGKYFSEILNWKSNNFHLRKLVLKMSPAHLQNLCQHNRRFYDAFWMSIISISLGWPCKV